MAIDGISSSLSHFSEIFKKKVIFYDFKLFIKKLGRNFFEKRPPYEIDVGHQFYMIKRNISFLDPRISIFKKIFENLRILNELCKVGKIELRS